jgi:RNA polymerase sigma-70 factor (ECF subfamily)
LDASLYQRYAPALIRKAERMLGNRSDAEDAVHGLFVQVMQIGRTEVDLPYLFAAATRRCLNLLRDQQKQASLLANHQPETRGPVRTRCEDRVIGLDLLIKLAEQLDEKRCTALVLHYFDDLSQEEVAEAMGMSRRTVGKYLKEVRSTLAGLSKDA